MIERKTIIINVHVIFVELCKATPNVCSLHTFNWVRAREKIFHSKYCTLVWCITNETSLVDGLHSAYYFIHYINRERWGRELYGHQGLGEGCSWWKWASLSFQTKLVQKSYPLGWYIIPIWLK